MGLMRDAKRALTVPRGSWRILGRATLELAVARVRLRADHSQHLRNAKAARRSPSLQLTIEETRLVEQVAFTIPRVAQRVPWRADCLVQALAGERWLRHCGIAAQVVIGVNKSGSAPLDAHAWLKAGDRVVTGGEIAAFVPLTD